MHDKIPSGLVNEGDEANARSQRGRPVQPLRSEALLAYKGFHDVDNSGQSSRRVSCGVGSILTRHRSRDVPRLVAFGEKQGFCRIPRFEL